MTSSIDDPFEDPFAEPEGSSIDSWWLEPAPAETTPTFGWDEQAAIEADVGSSLDFAT